MGVGFEWMVLDFARGERREGGGGGVFAFEEVADGDCGVRFDRGRRSSR